MCRNTETGTYQDHSAVIAEKQKLGKDVVRLRLHSPEVAKQTRPGQFVLLRPTASMDPLLARPLAVTTVKDDDVEICFHVVGRGTRILAEMQPGTALRLRGPQGNGFGTPSGKRLILVGGALGIAPLVFASQVWKEKIPTHFYTGVSCKTWSPLVDWLREEFPALQVACDDGTIGFHGNVVELVVKFLQSGDEIWACGPIPMMRALHIQTANMDVCLKVSLEERMACGFGGCLGCVIPTIFGHKRVCADGPVFESLEVDWDEIG